MDDIEKSINIIKNGSIELLVEDELIKKLVISKLTGNPMRIKFGLDPTASDIHIGHTIIFNKLRQLQDLGHIVFIVIGDFTSLIGDPTGCNINRPILTQKEIKKNYNTYISQINIILDKYKTRIVFNSKWLRNICLNNLLNILSYFTISRLLERDDFNNRLKRNNPILVYEILYPLMQGYDSVILKIDIEIGGQDQKFNLLVGRNLQKKYGQEKQCCLIMPLLKGLYGNDKMSKSKGNYIGITEKPKKIFGKIMSISDELMWHYFDLLSYRSKEEIIDFKKKIKNGYNPRDIKILLAKEIVSRFYSKKDSVISMNEFNYLTRGGFPKYIKSIYLNGYPFIITKLLVKTKLVKTISEAKRNIDQFGVKINNVTILDKNLKIYSGTLILQVGKRRFVKIILYK